MTTTIAKLYKRLSEPMNMAQPDIERFFVLGTALEFIMKSTGLKLFTLTPSNFTVYQDDGVTKLFEVDEVAGVKVNGSAITTIAAGIANFPGYTTYTDVTIPDQGTTSYVVQITPMDTGTPTGTLGQIGWKVIDAATFRVWNAGTATGQFSYFVTKL